MALGYRNTERLLSKKHAIARIQLPTSPMPRGVEKNHGVNIQGAQNTRHVVIERVRPSIVGISYDHSLWLRKLKQMPRRACGVEAEISENFQ